MFLNSDFLEKYQILKNIFVLDPLELPDESIKVQACDIKLSDIVIINKIDLVDFQKVQNLIDSIKQISSGAVIIATQSAQVELKQLNLDKTSPIEDTFVDLYEELIKNQPLHKLPTYAVFKSASYIHAEKIQQAISKLQNRSDITLKRAKGFAFDGVVLWEIQATSHHIEKKRVDSPLLDSKIVFIGENINQKTLTDFERYLYE